MGVERGVGVGGGWCGTLLGPEGSAGPGACVLRVGVCWWLLVPPLVLIALVWVVGVLVGLLFEIWIVDASIFCSDLF